MDKQQITSHIQQGLTAYGWTATHGGAALASKAIETAAGGRTALVYVQDWGANSTNYVLAGEYTSEGRNQLESHGVMVPKNADAVTVAKLVEKFSTDAMKVIDNTYARRLHLALA